MFNCYLHGWTSFEKPCRICHTVKTWASSSTEIDISRIMQELEIEDDEQSKQEGE